MPPLGEGFADVTGVHTGKTLPALTHRTISSFTIPLEEGFADMTAMRTDKTLPTKTGSATGHHDGHHHHLTQGE